MTSSTLSGDRRWPSSAKRGGLTVLGKVVVPKPINLPSQRSENNGSDPKVEIVPKGTLGWGSKSSSPWGSSSLSHNTDGGGGSPSHLSGRPSSGSGTRPSTASSDRAHEPTTNVCGPNSRPSSASGALTSNQTSLVALRPHSAETRPGSSQLSRFAEYSEQVAWNAAGTAENLGVTPSKNDGFSLTSRDFPTLGSAKENSDQSSRSRPGSSSSGLGTTKERIETSGASNISTSDNVKNSTVNSWKRDSPPNFEDGGRPGKEKWQGNPQTYPTFPQHYDGWCGPPLNSPQGGVWFRGPLGGPYGNLAAPAGYPMEPFPYYCPQIPTACLPNPHPVPPLGVGPRGPHPKNGDMYRPHMPDAFMGPGMRIRPDFYPGPLAYEGYYGPPTGYCSLNERDVPFMGMAAGPSIYNVYSGQRAIDPGNSQGRSSEYGSTNQTQIGEQVESIHPKDNQGPYKVLLKQHDSDDRKTEEHRSKSVVATDASREDQPRTFWEDDWRSYKKDEGSDLRKAPVEEASFQNSDNKGAPLVLAKVKSPRIGGNMKAIIDISGKKLESESIGLLKVPQPLIAAPKDSSLIQKIERLNAKARASDGRNEAINASSGEDRKNKFQANAKVMQNRNESSVGSSYLETCTTEISNSDTQQVVMSVGDKNLDSRAGTETNITRRSTHSSQSRDDHYGRGRIITQEVEGWQKEPSISESAAVVSTVYLETSNIHVQDHHNGFSENSGSVSLSHGKFEGRSVLPMFDRSDNQSQRAKMKELVKQKAKQLQEEEEERNKKQIARAFAKLEELNRRTQAIEVSTQKLENPSSGTVQNKQEESQPSGESSIGDKSYGMPKTGLGSKLNVVAQVDKGCTSGVENSCLSRGKLPSEALKSVSGEPVRMHAQSMPLQQEINGAIAAHNSSGPQAHESKVSKQKHTSFKQKQATSTEAPKTQADVEDKVTSLGVVANEVLSSGGSTVTVKSNANVDSSVHPRKKNSKNGKNKHKLEDASALSTSSPLGSKENLANFSVESSQPKAYDFQLNPSAVQLQTISRDADRSSEQHPSSPSDDSHGRVNSRWKPQQSHRVPRNPQGNRPFEKFHGNDAVVVWAPVRLQNKTELTDKASHKNGVDGVDPSVKSHPQVQNNLKNKRAEMERYVPKPVAKEMAQHGGNHHPMTSAVDHTIFDGSIGRDNSESTHNTMMVAGKMGFSAEPQNGISRHNKQGKAQGSWRQRVSTKSSSTQVLQDAPSYTINHGQEMQKLNAHEHVQNPDAISVQEQQKSTTDEWSATDEWSTTDNSVSVESIPVPTVKDQGVAVRGKRHGFKGHKSMLNNRDLDRNKSSSAENDKSFTQSSTSEMSQIELSVVSKENLGIGEQSISHLQPKAQAVSTGHQQGNRHNISQNVGAEVVLTNKSQSNRHDGVLPPPTHGKVTNDSLRQIYRDQPVSGRINAEDASHVRQQEPRRESKSASLEGKPHLPYQGPGNPVEPPPGNFDARQEQHMSGFRKRGNQNSMFNKSQESRGDWNYSGQDNKQHIPPSHRERSRRNSHYEYQPVGPYNNKFSNYDGPKDGTDSSGSGARAWGRGGQNHSRRGGGNFTARQSGV
ncbi:protein MODIFIER OF SNC1 1-like isoform X2 [Humulus lupulus]|uniref:protein MODIFIER OF SNC1 1-like isoform X2 n=1 Tax=Humulus lupulus TaxID=3486 RepID=UPI002B402938|nr:protein MODIFIER OF SNC1 1-like isoform X2 [Humulus lupulus]